MASAKRDGRGLLAALQPPLRRSTPFIGGLFGMHLDSLSPREAGVELVPERHRGLTQPPAEIDLVPVHQASEIAQADLVALELDAQALELVDITLEPFTLDIELVLSLGELLGVKIVGGTALLAGNRAIRCCRLSTRRDWRTISSTIALTSGRALLASSMLKYLFCRSASGRAGAMGLSCG